MLPIRAKQKWEVNFWGHFSGNGINTESNLARIESVYTPVAFSPMGHPLSQHRNAGGAVLGECPNPLLN